MPFGLSWRGILHLPTSCRSFFFAASSKKASSFVDEYLRTIRNISNQLAATGSPIPHTDLFYYTLGCLGPKYESFITTVSLQAENLPSEDLSSLPRSHEVRLGSLHNDLSNVTTLLSAKPPLASPNPSPQQGSSPQQFGRGGGRGCGYGFSSSRSFQAGQSSTSNPSRPVCQV